MKGKKKKIVLALVLVCLLVVFAATVSYVMDDYDSLVDETYLTSSDVVTVEQMENGLFFDGPGMESAYIFYPGGKVEYTAYAAIMYQLAENGMDCFLVEMPLQLALFDRDAAEDIMADYSYDTWYLGGHSLGGAMAAYEGASIADSIDGLILLASYETKDISDTDLRVLTIYGSEDQVMVAEKYESNLVNLPEDFTEIIIEGGNHGQFGDYGQQEGDGIATISAEEQQSQTVEAILEWAGL